jgi:hypothetical protein
VPDVPLHLSRIRDELAALSQRAQEQAQDASRLAETADRGVRAIDWLRNEVWPHVSSSTSAEFWRVSGDIYYREIGRAKEALTQSQFNLSSATSHVQLVVSGSTGFTNSAYNAVISSVPAEGPRIEITPIDLQRGSLQAALDEQLGSLANGKQLVAMRKGAWRTLYSGSPDAAAQACHSMREILTNILDHAAPNDQVKAAVWWRHVPETQDGVSKRQKLRYLLIGSDDRDVEDLIEEFDNQIDVAMRAHGDAIKIAHYRTNPSIEVARRALETLEDVMNTILDWRDRLSVSR